MTWHFHMILTLNYIQLNLCSLSLSVIWLWEFTLPQISQQSSRGAITCKPKPNKWLLNHSELTSELCTILLVVLRWNLYQDI